MYDENDKLPPALRAAMTLEAMRLGVVPACDLEEATVGRDLEIDVVRSDLAECKTGGVRRAFLGEYGLGKTHLLELIQSIALKENFLVSKAILDHSANTPAQPKRIYHALMHQIIYPDQIGQAQGLGLGPLLDKAAQDPQILEKYLVKGRGARAKKTLREQLEAGMHLYLSPTLAYANALNNPQALNVPEHVGDPKIWAGRAKHMLLDWIEGHPTQSNQEINDELKNIRGSFPKLYSLLDYRPWAKIYGYILNGIARLAKDVGYSGLVIVIDEAEFYTLLSPQNRAYAKSLFQAWSHAAGGADDFELPFTSDELLTGGYGIQRELPTRYCEDPGLYLVFAMTPNSNGIRVLQEAIPPQYICYLNPLSAYDYIKLTEHTIDVYAQSYPDCTLPEGIAAPLSEVVTALAHQGQLANPRQTLKFIIEFLDLVRFAPDKIGEVIANLMVQSEF